MFDFFCGDEVYGSCTELRAFFEGHGQAYVLRVPRNFRLTLPGGRRLTCADAASQVLDRKHPEVRSAGKGSKGGRWYAPEQGPATGRLVRDLFGLHRIVQRGTSGSEYQLFTLPHGEWIRLLGRCSLMVEDMIEVQVPPGAANHDFPELPDEWASRWPAEEVWSARRSPAS